MLRLQIALDPRGGVRGVIDPEFAVVLGVAFLAFSFVTVAYVVWTRIVGMEPTLAQRFAEFSTGKRAVAAVGFGVLLGVGAELAPSVQSGVAAAVLLAAASFAGLIAFEVYEVGRVTP